MRTIKFIFVILLIGIFEITNGTSRESIMNINVEGKNITIFKSGSSAAPLVVLHEYAEVRGYDITSVWCKCQFLKTKAFTLAVIPETDREWNAEMSPWPMGALYKGDTPCEGKADQYLETLTTKIISAIETKLSAKPTYVALAGYSLAGLFAVYSAYKTDIFERIASASGSFWYPGFPEYVKRNQILKNPHKLYLSLGDKECQAREKILQPVQKNTEEIYRHFSEQGINAVFELNPGNHFQHVAERMAKGIAWILEDEGLSAGFRQ